MPFLGIADTRQRAILIAALEDICLVAGLEDGSPERDEAASLIMQFYGKGYRTAEELKAAFGHAIREERFG